MMGNARICICALAAIAALCASGFEKVPHEVAKALKIQRLKSIDTGLVFIDGKYVKPPYRVARSGNQILINDRPVTGPIVAWEEFVKTQPPSNLKTIEVEDTTPAVRAAPKSVAPAAEDGIDPAAPKDGGTNPPEPAAEDETAAVRVVIVERNLAADADDLDDFKTDDAPEKMKLSDIPADTEEDKARQKRAEEEKEEEKDERETVDEAAKKADVPTTDANGDELDPASPEGEAAAKAVAEKNPEPPKPVVKMREVRVLAGPFEENSQSRLLLKKVNAVRDQIGTTLRRGGYVFFGTKYRRVTGDAMGTKAILKALPEAMREASDFETFYHTLQSKGLMTYLTYPIVKDLYRNKTDFFQLMERRRALAEEEKLKKLMNREH